MSGLVGKAGAGELNVEDRTIFEGDNLGVMRGMNDSCVDLIYLDPPFNSDRDYQAVIGTPAEGTGFKDTWYRTDVDDEEVELLEVCAPAAAAVCRVAESVHGDSMYSYLCMMAPRLLEMRRILKPAGSIYLHCDPTANSYLRLLMDAIFGKKNRRNEIVWHYKGNAGGDRRFSAKHDTILLYGGSETVFHKQYLPYSAAHQKRFNHMEPETGRRFYWNSTAKAGRYKTYMKEGVAIGDTWTDIQNLTSQRQKTGYDTQKPLALLKRIILASSNPGDVVLDPFCGCATACVAAEMDGDEGERRRWVGIDVSPQAVKLVKMRLRGEIDAKPRKGWKPVTPDMLEAARKVVPRKKPPVRTDKGPQPRPSKWKALMYGEQGGFCKGCEEHFLDYNLEIDHIVPQSKGGGDDRENLQLLCGHCNRVKGTGTQAQLKAELRRKGILAPLPEAGRRR